METHRLRALDRLLVALAVPALYALGRTLRFEERGCLAWSARVEKTALWVSWHETLLLALWFFRGLAARVMISASRDGELVARIAQRFGFVPVRGSTSRGAFAATRELVAQLRAGERAAITPDGPRGPRRRAQAGLVGAARLSGRPVIAVGIGVQRCWRLRSWDRFAVPKPFSRVRLVYGEPVHVPHRGGSDEEWLARIQAEMDRVTRIAEDWGVNA
jgi:lysophospholipid acyltransferase (LPLAT)-like uncharacterized protein